MQEKHPPIAQQILLAVLAHPDDETFGIGGTLALYAQRGVAVHLVCATRGEAGEVSPDLMEGFSSIAERRETELRCAAGILGLAGVYFLDYRDSGMPGSQDNHHAQALAAAPLDEVSAKVAHYIRSIKPQVILTNDPIGGYKHPDHIAVHKATVKAFELAGDPAFQDGNPPFRCQKLYFHVFPKGWLRYAVWLLPLFGMDPRRFGRNQDIDLKAIVLEGDFPVHAEIDFRSVSEKRDAAAACHASQLGSGPPRQGIMRFIMRWFGRKEQFMRSFPEPASRRRERDLFEGILETQ